MNRHHLERLTATRFFFLGWAVVLVVADRLLVVLGQQPVPRSA
jgi:hypothetical protein